MPEFHLDTGGEVPAPPRMDQSWPWTVLGRPADPMKWRDLDAFAQGYVEALFFTDCEHGSEQAPECDGMGNPLDGAAMPRHVWNPETDSSLPGDVAFSDLAPEALAAILADCARFQAGEAWRFLAFSVKRGDGRDMPDDAQAGRDFWYTRNGHGCGFWDGDWPEPYATALTAAAKAFREVDAYLGDDGKVYLS